MAQITNKRVTLVVNSIDLDGYSVAVLNEKDEKLTVVNFSHKSIEAHLDGDLKILNMLVSLIHIFKIESIVAERGHLLITALGGIEGLKLDFELL